MQPMIGIVLDPLMSLHPEKDSTVAMIAEAITRGYKVIAIEPKYLSVFNGVPSAKGKVIKLSSRNRLGFQEGVDWNQPLEKLSFILMRKDPPFDMEYIYATYVLDLAQKNGVPCINPGQALRDFNEKFFINYFSNCIADTLVTKDPVLLKSFILENKKTVLKPLDGMGGKSIFTLNAKDPNLNVILETLNMDGKQTVMAQRYLSDIKKGDKRVLIINGVPINYLLRRIPSSSDPRGNLVRGATAKAGKLDARDRWLCEQIAPTLIEKNLMFVGIDIIGRYITEINITSPTGIRELDRQCKLNISKQLFDAIESRY
jgi:glutathione synthase